MKLPLLLAQTDNIFLTASVSADSEDSTYPVSNILALPVAKPFRTDGATSVKVLFDLAAAAGITLLALVNHNLTAAATITFRGGSSSDPDGSEFQQTLTWADRVIWLEVTANWRYWSLIVTDAGNPDGFLHFGYFLAGSATEFPMEILPDWVFTRYYINRELESETGVPLVGINLSEGRIVQFAISGLSVAEAQTIDTALSNLKRSRTPALIVPKQDFSVALFGRLIDQYAITHSPGYATIENIGFREDPFGILAATS